MSTTESPNRGPIALFSLSDGQALLERVCERLSVDPGQLEEREFEDGEHKIRPLQSVRGGDVYLVQSLYGGEKLSVNDKLMRVLFFLAAVRDAGARRVTAVVPYLCYSRKDMRTKARDPVSTRYVAELFESVGVDRLVTMDVHNRAAFQNAFRIPTEHLTAGITFVEKLAPRIDAGDAVVVSPDAGGVKRAERVRQLLQKRLGRPVGSAFIEKFRSEGKVRGGTVVGDVQDRIAIIVDDLISSGTTLAHAASGCLEQGASSAVAAVTHGVFSADAEEVIGDSKLERLLVMDTIPVGRFDGDEFNQRLEVLDCSELLASAIECLHTDGSIVDLVDHH